MKRLPYIILFFCLLSGLFMGPEAFASSPASKRHVPEWVVHCHRGLRGIILGAEGGPEIVAVTDSLVGLATGRIEASASYDAIRRFQKDGTVEVTFPKTRKTRTATGQEVRYNCLMVTPPGDSGWMLVIPGFNLSYDGYPLRIHGAGDIYEMLVRVVEARKP